MDWKQLGSDFKQKYEHCYCFVTLEGRSKPEMFYLDQVEINVREAPFLHFDNDRVGSIILKYDDSKSDLDFRFPTVGLMGYSGKTLMVRRKFERQWKGGICPNTVTAQDIYKRYSPHVSTPYWTCELIEAMFAPRPTLSIREGLSRLKKDVSVPLSNEFAIGLPITDTEDLILFYHENPIGTINPSTEKVVLKELQFSQEFEDFKKLRGLGHYEIY